MFMGQLNKLFLAFVLCTVAAGPVLADGGAASSNQEKPTASVKVVRVKTGDLPQIATVYGKVQPDPDQSHTIAMPHDGIITRVYVRKGQIIKTGEKLAQLENSPGVAAQYAQAKAEETFARKNLKRKKRMLKEQMATKDDVAQAKKALSLAQAKIDQMKASGADTKTQILRSPFDGIVTAVNVSPGEHVKADAIMLSVCNQRSFIVDLGIEPEDISYIHPGTDVTLTSLSNSKVKIQAKVSSVSGMIDPKTHLVDASVLIQGPDTNDMVLGMMLEGKVTLKTYSGALIPHKALMYDEKGPYIFTVKNNKAHRVYVAINFDNDALVSVKNHLDPSDVVVVQGNVALKDGDAVNTSPVKGG